MEFRVLGPLEICSAGAVVPVRSGAQRALLAALLLSANQVVPADRLVELIWGAEPPASAEANLRTHVSALRRLLQASGDGSARLVTRPGGGYLIEVGTDDLDLLAFDALVREGRRALREDKPGTAVRRLSRALGLWRGRPLEDVVLHGDGHAETARLAEVRLGVVEDCLVARLATGEHADVVGELSGLVVEHPLRESLWALLMLALHRSGRQADALAAYERVRLLTAEELGADPGPELRKLHQRLLTGELATPPPTPAPGGRCDLPADLSDFTGRRQELNRVIAGLEADGACAMVISAIDGMGGVGKTALAVHLAHRLAERYPDGQMLIDLQAHHQAKAPLSPSDALERLLRAAGVRGEQIPPDEADRSALWRSTLTATRTLVVLDNATDSAQVRPLLPGAPGCLALVTSRRRLGGVDGAQHLSLDVLPPADATALLERIVGDARPSIEPDAVAELLALCGHLPLAIRIAGSRLRNRATWTVAHLVERLRDVRVRLAELRAEDRDITAVFSLSYQCLTGPQQRQFRLLGLSPGPDIDLRAAAALAGRPEPETEDLLEDLVDVNLLQQPEQGRYRFHDLVRAYAASFATTEDSAALTRLFDHYRDTTATAASLLAPAERRHDTIEPGASFTGPDDALTWLDAERANLLAAAAHAAEHGWPGHVRDLSAALARYLNARARHTEALALHTAAWNAARRDDDPAGAGHALHDLGRVHFFMGCYDRAVQHLDFALDIARRTGDRTAQSHALNGLGYALWRLGRHDEALGNLLQATAIAGDLGDRIGLGYMTCALGGVHGDAGRYDEAVHHLERALALTEETGDQITRSNALGLLANAHEHLGHHTEARHHYRQALATSEAIGERGAQVFALNGLGETATATNAPTAALTHHQAALTLATEINDRHEQARAHHGLGNAHQALGNPQQAKTHWYEALNLYTARGASQAALLSQVIAT
ncbi:AfsR/SARP family transcriptional regulator [Actinomadura rupiterrae]|uniref:AfsR/SARP family transcriptional regulator n=1 Tax=Actinomadura rupiterrae TaxID=559627 RepID=UPI0020A49FC7|nr:BTAD domain-containing putative transcriptional regulator [Actinomadura rupiterrae]MCP2336568.1 DNA-binding SARP family transcriptional activator/tetratricopeptide (TPR) repeat protein [Actinomadura rupiterrae]